MRVDFWTCALLLVGGVVANPVKEESMMTVDVAENVVCDGSHFVVSVQRTDDVKEDSGELIAEKISNIVFDFKVDRKAEELLINGYALKLVPQRVRKLSLLAAVISPDQGLPLQHGAVESPEVVSALRNLERNGLVTADVGLSVSYTDGNRDILISVRVVQVEGKQVLHKDLLAARITLPQLPGHVDRIPGMHPHPAGPAHVPVDVSCAPFDWQCRINAFLAAVTPSPRGPCPGRAHRRPPHPDGVEWDRQPEDGHQRHRDHPGRYHRHRFHRPHHGFMRFIIGVVIPVLIGAAVGVGIGILSVFVAEIAGGVILRLRGRREHQYIEIEEDYDELPAYVALEEVECTDEKQEKQEKQ